MFYDEIIKRSDLSLQSKIQKDILDLIKTDEKVDKASLKFRYGKNRRNKSIIISIMGIKLFLKSTIRFRIVKIQHG